MDELGVKELEKVWATEIAAQNQQKVVLRVNTQNYQKKT
jgi:hypothetical protein